ncbi:MAG: stage V sporulation protein AB [Clostridia bacterium]|nr:stage V sporulation protein AB [Clostridia bacterium]
MMDSVIAVFFGLLGGSTLGLCMAPLWMMLELPMRVTDIFNAGSMKLCAIALALGATIGTSHLEGFLPDAVGELSMAFGGLFVGMFAAALEEAVEVVPVLFDRLSITTDMRFAAAAMSIGKTIGAITASFMGV